MVETDQLKQLAGKEEVGCVSDLGGKAEDDKVRRDNERDARRSSPQPGRR